MRVALVDTGPLVSLLDSRDKHHRWAIEAMGALPGPLTTCEAVLTEACYLLARWPAAVDALLDRAEKGVLKVVSLSSELGVIRRLMRKYSNVPMSFADASLVRLAELHDDAVVVTLDSDFRVYRRNGRRTVPVIAPQGR